MSELKCKCLFEIENKLPRTKFCSVPCRAQYEILSRRESKEWWDNLDENVKKALHENYTILTEDEIHNLRISENRKKFNPKN